MHCIGLLVQRVMHNSVHMASHMERYLAKYTLTKRQIKMQRNFYSLFSPPTTDLPPCSHLPSRSVYNIVISRYDTNFYDNQYGFFATI